MKRSIIAASAAAALLALAIPAGAEEHQLSAVSGDALVAQDGDVYIASQPSLEDLDAWSERGVTTVVNFRSQAETEALDFSPAGEVQARGMSYVSIPMGGADGVQPDIRTRLAQVLATSRGPVVLHCRSGVRAAHAYAAYLVGEGEASSDDVASTIGWPGGLSDDTLAILLEE